ncbi:hypothetical protein O1611_g774 [Lasiodiplodia mahajangana]|uniref:Uncharacterized protein n=1 Tax=Lasiodiplodia mahajangana TaxID=1108764 RepID=A0ACC2JZA4_9PEZI|nr:hypothetical protein O1611_g774 [Lasiodiplodia mahajangana]
MVAPDSPRWGSFPRSQGASETIASIDINTQELERLGPSVIQASYADQDGTLALASAYTSMLLQLADNAFVMNQSSVTDDEQQGANTLYHLHIFGKYAEKWVDRRLEKGPFVLVYGDLEPCSLLVDNDMRVVCILDWEQSRVVPLQFFKPPLWLANPLAMDLAHPKSNGKEVYGNELLEGGGGGRANANSGFLVATPWEIGRISTGLLFAILTGNGTEDRTCKNVIAYTAATEALKNNIQDDVGMESDSVRHFRARSV